MTLTAQFNSKAKIDSREDAERETFGGKSLSRYFCALALRKKQQPKVEIKIVEVPVPVRAVRAPLWRM